MRVYACVRVYSYVYVYVCKWRFLESINVGRRLDEPQKGVQIRLGKVARLVLFKNSMFLWFQG